MVQAPTRDPSDFCIAHRAKSALFIPEVAKSMSTPKRVQHVISFAFLEVSFIRRIVRVSFASDFYVSFNGDATREQQPHFNWLPLLITCFPEEEPVTASMPLKVFLFEPSRVFIRVSSSGPLPQTIEDCVIYAIEHAFTRHVPMIICPTSYFGVEFLNQIGGRHSKRGFDRSSDTIQEGLNVFLGWFAHRAITLGPHRLDAGRCTVASRFRCRSCDRGIRCRSALDRSLPSRHSS